MSAPLAVSVAAQAKVNLRLVILAREASGWHQLETLFLRLELADSVRVRRTSGPRSLDVSGDVDLSAIGPVERNLAWRAAESFADATEMRGGFAIEIHKRIPLGGGLGGGSADAGAVLRAMNAMADAPLSPDALIGLGERLGADVPFLTTTNAYAFAWGRGERMLALEPPPQRAVTLAFPEVHVNTADAYGWLSGLEAGRRAPGLLLRVDELSDWRTLAPLASNTFEFVVPQRFPAIQRLVNDMWTTEACLAMMSGSGSTVFAVAADATPDMPPALRDAAVRTLATRTAGRVEPVVPIE
ncbi:MAG: 4-(cytidine 5'-diphospho)-2-C-methyl-D-erythritol kinase [Gemmatimonadaceae bacterium]